MIEVKMSNKFTRMSMRRQKKRVNKMIYEWVIGALRNVGVTLNEQSRSKKTALADFDITIVYGINPNSVAELYSTKSKSFHHYDEKGKDTYLMYNYMVTLVNNASYKVVRGYTNLSAADNRQELEQKIRELVTEQLKS